MSSLKENAGWFGMGCGMTLILSAVFAFYPAFVMAVAVKRQTHGVSDEGDMVGLGVFILSIAIIIILTAAKQYFIVLMMYIITLWPFLYMLHHLAMAPDLEKVPVPLDWCFLW